MAKTISAILTDGERAERFYFETVEADAGSFVAAWRRNGRAGLYRTERYGDELGRDWVRKFAADGGQTVEKW